MKNITEDNIRIFVQKLEENEKSPATVKKYVSCLEALMRWLDGDEITKIRLIAYRDELRAQGSAVSTVNAALSAINAYLGLFDMTDCRVKFLKQQRSVFRPAERELTREEFARLVAAAQKQGNQRLVLIMETICSAGIRVSESRYITVEAAQNGRAEISMKGKNRTILLPKKLCRKLLKYAKKKKIVSGAIFLTRNGTPLTRSQIWAEMKALSAAAHVEPSKVFPHNLRHLFARCFYKMSCDIAKLADVLGHSSIETTRIYLMSTGIEHERTLNKMRLVS